ncbi:unnamed protein product [Rotaria sordida]|uniref:Otopetrin n=1 Tax=Rotaria sordida TaxID=392033 RepID=A0A819C1J4_9BILA|nr:unnamed protein product [Rotaria sordida]
MFPTSNIPMNYLKVPTNEKLDNTESRRTCSFIQNPNRIKKRAPSNASLPCINHGILKSSNSSHRPQSISSRSSVYYTPMISEDDDKVELISSIIVPPTTESSSLINNNQLEHTHKKNDGHFNIPRQYGLSTLLRKSYWSNHPFSLKGSNDENIDAYKIVSILYGLVIFIVGVAFSISHAIIPPDQVGNIRHLAEIYFTYLYCVSIIWIFFCIIDIVRHQQKFNINSKAIKRLDSTHKPIHNPNLHLLVNKRQTSSLNQQISQLPPVPSFNLQLFDDSDEFQSEDNDNENSHEQNEINSHKQTHDNDDDDDDDKSLRHTDKKSHSFDDLSAISSDVVRKRYNRTRSVSSRRPALDPGGAHNLRTYVRHRKDSIVQRVMGYNYDDHSTAGGLYIRVGIGIFCLGTVIHSGLSILSNLENRSCARWTALMDDCSRLLFSFIQFFFIFKHSNLIIRAHEGLARLAVMHIVVTNLCVWFRMVVVETKSQIIETGAHEMAIVHVVGGSSHSMNNSHHSSHQNYPSSTVPYHCLQSIEEARLMNAFINEGYMRLKPLLYPCTIEFSLMSLTLFYLIWENIGKTFAYKMSDKASTKNVFMVNCHASIKGLFAGMIVFSCTVISVILYAVFRNKIGDDLHSASSLTNHAGNVPHNRVHSRGIIITNTTTTTLSTLHHVVVPSSSLAHSPLTTTTTKTPTTILYSIAIVEIVNLSLLLTSLTATLWALMKIRKLQYKRTTTRFDDVLIIVALAGTYLYTIFSAFALLSNKDQSTWLAYLKIAIVVLEFIESTVHAFLILVALRKRIGRLSKLQYPAREIITLLIMLDLSLWFEETTTTTKHEANPFQLAFYHTIPWSIISAIATPLQIFFRFHASVCLSHVWENMYILPAFEQVAPHGL